MPEDDLKTGTTASEQQGGSAPDGATGTADAATAGGSAGTSEQDTEYWRKKAEEEAEKAAENERKFNQLLSQKSNFERRSEPPAQTAPETPPNQPGSAWEQEAQRTAHNLQRVMAMYDPNTVEHENAKAAFLALQSQYATQQYLQRQSAIEYAVSGIPDMARRERARQKLLSGQASTVENALALIDGEDARAKEPEAERLRKENEKLRKDLEAAQKARTSGGPPPLVGAGVADPSVRYVTLADHSAEIDALERRGDRAGVLKILSDVSAGRRRFKQ